jgi:adenylate cyclase
MKKDTIIDLLVPVIIGLLLVGLALTPVYHGIQWGLYDVLLRLKPSIEEDPAITIVNIDDETIEELNIYPLTRDIMAQGLVTLTEFNAGVIGIDSEFIDKSPRGIREDIITQKIPDAIIDTMEIINGYIKTMASQIDTGQISASEAILEVSISNSVLFNDLFNTSQQAVIDFDNLLGNSARFSNNAHATITPAQYDNEKVSLLTTEQQATIRNAESKDFILDNIALKNIEIIEESPFQYVDFVTPAILPVMMGMVGAGNVRQYVDQDGVRRRVDLLINWEGGYFPHLGFSSVLYYLGYPKLEVYKDKVEIHLEDTLFDPPEPQKLTTISDIEVITIPLDEEGRMIINWIPEPYVDQFQHLSFIDLIHYESDFSELLEDLLVLHQFVPFWNESWEIHPIDLETNWLNALNNGYQINNPEYRTIYQANRQAFLESARIHIETAYKDWREYLEADFLNVDPESLDDESLIQYDLLVNQNLIPRLYQKLKDTLDLHEKISSAVMGNLIIIGYSGQSTTDIGVNPFQKEYMNVGTMANVANMILQNEFVDEVAWYWSFLLILPLTFLITLMFKQLSPTRGALTGLGLLLVIFLGYWGLFVTTGLFMDLAMALLMVGLTFITTIIISFRRTNTQKSFIRDAFGQYLSNDVINELLDNPDKLKLGGRIGK